MLDFTTIDTKLAQLARTRDATAPIQGVDLFCGVGGLTHGLSRGGIPVIAGIDLDPAGSFPYEHNNRAVFIESDIQEISADDLARLYGATEIRLLAGCAPCQPFSRYSQKGRAQRQDTDWKLLLDFGRLIREVQPELVTMENVPELQAHPVFQDFLSCLEGYEIWQGVVDCTQYSIPQTRKRFVLLASRLGPIHLLSPEESGSTQVTVRDAIAHLPPLEAGTSDEQDPIHIASRLSDLNLRRIRASKQGGTWRDWDESLRASCHRKATGQTYSGVYGRMEWNAPAPTITTQCFGYGNGRFGHPEQDRAISLREAAILQTFPQEYQFLRPKEQPIFSKLGKLIGNAVPVRIGEIIALSFIKHLETYRQIQEQSSFDQR